MASGKEAQATTKIRVAVIAEATTTTPAARAAIHLQYQEQHLQQHKKQRLSRLTGMSSLVRL